MSVIHLRFLAFTSRFIIVTATKLTLLFATLCQSTP